MYSNQILIHLSTLSPIDKIDKLMKFIDCFYQLHCFAKIINQLCLIRAPKIILKMRLLLPITLISVLFGAMSISGLIVEGPCRYKEITVMKSLNLDSYLGVWYELERYDVPIRQNADCIKLEMKSKGDEKFESAETGYNYFEGKNYGVKAEGVVPESGSAKMKYWYESRKYEELNFY